MTRGRIKIVGAGRPGFPMKGQDVGVYAVDDEGKSTLLPVRSVKFEVAARGGIAKVTLETAVDLVEIDGEVEIEPAIPEHVDG